jgi:hypothetical protein
MTSHSKGTVSKSHSLPRGASRQINQAKKLKSSNPFSNIFRHTLDDESIHYLHVAAVDGDRAGVYIGLYEYFIFTDCEIAVHGNCREETGDMCPVKISETPVSCD